MIQFTTAVWAAILPQSTAAGRANALAGLGIDTIEFLDAAAAVIRTVTTGAWTVSGANAVPGAYTDAGTGGGTPSVAVFKAGATEIMRMTCGTLAGADYRLLANIVAGVPIRRGPFAVLFLPPPEPGTSQPSVVTAPTISGVAKVGQTLTATPGVYAGNPVPTITRQWYSGATAIPGATGLFVTLTDDELGGIITFVETPSNSVGSITVTSNALGPVVAADLNADAVPNPVNIDLSSSFDFAPYIVGGVPPYRVAVGAGYSLPSGASLPGTGTVLTVDGTVATGLTADFVFDIDDSAVAATLPTFGVLSAAGGSDLPFTFGHVFSEGEVPAGSYVDSDLTDWQVEPRNMWGDGSLAFAVISGRATCAQNVRKDIALSVSLTPRSGSNVAAVTAADVGTTTVSIGGNTVSLADAINGADLTSFSGTAGVRPADAGRLRTITGPVMTESHYYAPVPNLPGMAVFWHIRKYVGGRIWVETVTEIPWSRIAGITQVTATQTIVVNGTTVYSASVAHRARSRWSIQSWIGGDPQITPKHDTAYMRASKMVPNFTAPAPSEATLNALVQSVGPMERGPFDASAAAGGYHAHIGLLPKWDALYVTSNASDRAYRAVLAAEQASNCGSLSFGTGFAWRDEATLKPINLPSFYNDSVSNGYSPTYGAGRIYLATNTDTYPWSTDPAHGWAAGYMAYLVTGRWFSLETIQMGAGADFLCWGISGGTNDGQRWMNNQDRAAGWSMRTLACALAMTPETVSDQAALKAGYKSHLETGWNKWHTNEIGFNALGIRKNIYNYTDYNLTGSKLSCGAFQQYFLAQAFAWGYQIAGHLLGASYATQWLESARFHAGYPVGLGGTAATYCYRHAAQYGMSVGPDRTVDRYDFYDTFAEMYAANAAEGRFTADATCAVASDLEGGGFPDATSYWGNYLPALALAVEITTGAEQTAAQDAWDRVTGASNWSLLNVDFADSAPHFGVTPR